MGERVSAVAALVILCAAPRVGARPLAVGDLAPAIQVKAFLKGTPVHRLEKGKCYVVEFWATWCAPCRISIPHLTELQKQYPRIRFIGVSVWEQNQRGVKPFVEQMGDKMAYTVAMDNVPVGADGHKDGAMAKAWMEAAGQEGIPTAFLISASGKIAWIGHPLSLDGPLKALVAGTWDLAAARSQFQTEQARQRAMEHLQEELARA